MCKVIKMEKMTASGIKIVFIVDAQVDDLLTPTSANKTAITSSIFMFKLEVKSVPRILIHKGQRIVRYDSYVRYE